MLRRCETSCAPLGLSELPTVLAGIAEYPGKAIFVSAESEQRVIGKLECVPSRRDFREWATWKKLSAGRFHFGPRSNELGDRSHSTSGDSFVSFGKLSTFRLTAALSI